MGSRSMGHVLVIEAYDQAFVNFRRDFVELLLDSGWQVTAMAPEFSTSVRRRLTKRGVPTVTVHFSRGSINPLREYETVSRLSSKLSELRPDAVIAFGPKPVIYSGLVKSDLKFKRIGVVTGLGYAFTADGPRAKFVNTMQRLLYRRALENTDTVLFQNEDDRSEFERAGILDVHRDGVGVVNGSGVDLKHFASVPLSAEAAPVFLFVGRLQSSKGFDDFVKAAQIVRRSGFESRFIVVGWRDEQNPQVIGSKAYRALRGSDIIEFRGRMEDVREALRESTVFVLPSYREGTPRSVLEAMSVGRAIITTDVPGCRETVVHGWNGYLVQPRHPYDIASAMVRYCTNSRLAVEHGQNSRKFAERKFDVRRVNQSILDIGSIKQAAGDDEDMFGAMYSTGTSYNKSEARDLARLHLEAFPNFFMSSLGEPFLFQFYMGYRNDDTAVVSLLRDGHGKIVGIAVGTTHPSGFFRRLLSRRLLGFAAASAIAAVRNPSSVRRLVRGFFYRGDGPEGRGGALLSSIAVDPAYQGQGLGRRLLTNWVSEATRAGAETAFLTTDAADNQPVNHLYATSGWVLENSYVTPEGRCMNMYEIVLN